MDYRNILQKVLDSMDENLGEELAIGQIAGEAGFSRWHFSRIFEETVGISPAHYRTLRRLQYAIYAAQRGQSLLDAALAYGFDSYAGFYKAFLREFGCSPSAYLQKTPARPPARFQLEKEAYRMLTHETARKVLRRWGMEQASLEEYRYPSSGYSSESRLWVDKTYLLQEGAAPGVLEKERKMAQLLRKGGFAAPHYLPDSSGSTIAEEEGRWFSLYTLPETVPLMAAELMKPGGETLARRVGAAIAGMHRAIGGCGLPLEERDLEKEAGEWALTAVKREGILPLELCSRWEREFPALYRTLPRQPVHRGLNPGNVLFDGERVIGFQEWNLSTREARIFDPCCFAAAVLSETWGKMEPDGWKGMLAAILDGYDSVVPLSSAEREAAPLVILANQFVFIAWTAEREKLAPIAKVNREMTLWIWKTLFC